MTRIQERLYDFMKIPIDRSELLYHYYQHEGFPATLSNAAPATDRTVILKYLVRLNTPPIELFIYISFEDGTILHYADDHVTMEYREPGNSGYRMENYVLLRLQ
jgi:hypothetical protein